MATPKTKPKKKILKKTLLKKPARKTKTPVLKIVQEELSTPVAVNKERSVEIRRVEQMPISPYIIEFKTEESTPVELETFAPAVKPVKIKHEIELPSEPAPVTKPFELDEKAMEMFFSQIEVPKIIIEKEKKPGRLQVMAQAFRHHLDQKQTEIKTKAIERAKAVEIEAPQFIPTKKTKLANFRLSTNKPLLRAAAGFAIVALIFTLPAAGLQAYTKFEQTKNALTIQSQEALEKLGQTTGQPEEVAQALSEASLGFGQTKQKLEEAVGALGVIMPIIPKAGHLYRSGTLLLDGGAHLAEAGRIIASGFATLTDITNPLGSRLIHLEESIRAAFPLIRAAELELGGVSVKSLPVSAQTLLPQVTQTVQKIRSSFAEPLEILPALSNFLGVSEPKRYLVVFQNPDEIRATGGFIGSFALLDIDQGEITNLEVPGGGPYDLACCLTEHVISPGPLHLIEPHWQFHDANWFPDFPTSAQKLEWFYGKSGGPSVDGVIAINSSVIPTLLEIVGPIELPSFGRTFTAENFIEETQKIVELEYDKKENKPKAVIGELAPILLGRLIIAPPEKLLPILEAIGQAALNKEIQLYANDPEIEQVFEKAGWAGEIKETNGDYLSIVSSNIAGGKSNAKIETSISHRATVGSDGTIIDRVEITKTHTGLKNELFSGVRNVDYLRVYVPLGSKLIETSGFEAPPADLFKEPEVDYEPDKDLTNLIKQVGQDLISGTDITTENNKTVFGNWMQIDPGKTQTVSLTYELPNKLGSVTKPGLLRRALGVPERLPYTLLVQAQSGVKANFEHELIAPSSLIKSWGETSISEILTKDLFTATLFER